MLLFFILRIPSINDIKNFLPERLKLFLDCAIHQILAASGFRHLFVGVLCNQSRLPIQNKVDVHGVFRDAI